MANSAWSGNTAGLASATSAGLVGTGAQTFAGKKTLDGGALIAGDQSGLGISIGYVGYNTFVNSATAISISGAYNILATISNLQKGTYLISVRITGQCSASTAFNNLKGGFSVGSGNVTPYYISTVENTSGYITLCSFTFPYTNTAVQDLNMLGKWTGTSLSANVNNDHTLSIIRIA